MNVICLLFALNLALVIGRPQLDDAKTLESAPITPEASFIIRSRAKRALLRSHWHGRHTDYSLESAEHKIIRRTW
ncbi:unnamed protein product [Bursaphelenchus xylophilus]|uniref:(pine wood nematode) hypothetical protein n=1 Tax=Bursaphelenchus xylophilus TaxID=6326 RepID=A0A811LER3_BURXY|nr:unnamed protein product [Bursaphelenchus xylophilus]CAG9116061.1 unnamed protein product [Bursaphelenchus xylophilus]